MNEEIKASVDSPEFREQLDLLLRAAAMGVTSRYLSGFIAHINAWGEQLAASRAVLPVTDSLRAAILGALDVAESSLDYRPEFRRAMSNLHRVTNEILSSATPVAGWVSVEERLPEPNEEVLAYRPLAALTNDPEVSITRYLGKDRNISPQGVKHGFDCWCHPTHWMPAPPAPAATPTQQNQQEQS